ncbi:MAG: hypothetical protein Q4B42_02535 [Oscillospiraceae bacterium]|nr:hypothetical protein [Oscillospiraceae bacterium]
MLYHVSFIFKLRPEDYTGFFERLDALGRWVQPFDGCVLVSTALTAEGLRAKLLPYLGELDKLVISKMFRGQCAGRLPGRYKTFIKGAISRDPSAPEQPS